MSEDRAHEVILVEYPLSLAGYRPSRAVSWLAGGTDIKPRVQV